jgi:hypothetical protein
MKQTALLLALVVLLLLTGVALAMSSDNYRLDWFAPLTSSGGGEASSSNYIVNLTVGQSAIGVSASTNYRGCLGYWCGVAVEYRVYLPLVLQND